jgi:uncharacterized protein (TIGR02118 family)
MIRVTVLYPNQEGNTFDIDYYCKVHMPMAQRLLGAVGISAELGIGGGAPGSATPYLAIGHLLFESLEVFQNGIATHGPEIMADIPKYTNAAPVIQISEVRL